MASGSFRDSTPRQRRDQIDHPSPKGKTVTLHEGAETIRLEDIGDSESITYDADEDDNDYIKSLRSKPSSSVPLFRKFFNHKKSLSNAQSQETGTGIGVGTGNKYSPDYIELTPEDDSPYPEVRASVPNVDDLNLPQNTLRMWAIGLLMTTIGCAVNVVFSFHSPVFVVSTFVSAIIAWPFGRLWDKVVPNVSIFGLPLNPSPFNLKEHALITIMASVSFGSGAAYMTDIIVTMRHFYGLEFGWGFQVMGMIATQAIGYSIAGLARRILVYPASMIWPSNLVTTTFLTNIHLNVNHVADGWRISRLRFFLSVLLGSFTWYWLPGFLAPFLSDFGFLTWITPNNIVINQMFGTSSGLGMMPITFDWNQIAGYIGSPLIPPFFAVGNIFVSLILVFWIITPILHFCNVWYGQYLPMSDVNSYDRFQNVYNSTRILTKSNVFDKQQYEDYSPLFLPTTFAVSYGLSFASFSSTIVHTILFHGHEIVYYWKNSRNEPDDVHMRLMKRYKEAPDWWFAVLFAVFLVMSILCVRLWDTGMPIWALILALIIASLLLIPVGMIYALTNISVGLNVISEFIVGYLLPGHPIAMIFFKTFGYITNSQAITFLQDMKLGHYMKISPRVLFAAQLVATLWGGIVQLAVLSWSSNNIRGFCSTTQEAGFTCPAARVFYNASVIWGVIGPQRQFGPGEIYHSTLYFFLVGATLPLLNWLFLKRYPKSIAKYIHWPVFFTGTGYIPPATPFTYGSYCAVAYIFGYWIKRKYFGWWAKYNYSLSAGLDLGLALGSLCIFVLTLSPHINAPVWWGTTVVNSTADSRAAPLIKLSAGQSFGPSTW